MVVHCERNSWANEHSQHTATALLARRLHLSAKLIISFLPHYSSVHRSPALPSPPSFPASVGLSFGCLLVDSRLLRSPSRVSSRNESLILRLSILPRIRVALQRDTRVTHDALGSFQPHVLMGVETYERSQTTIVKTFRAKRDFALSLPLTVLAHRMECVRPMES